MAIISNSKLIESLLVPDNFNELELCAKLYKRHGRVEFTILKVNDDSIKMMVTQSKSPSGIYLSKEELVNRAEELFNQFFPSFQICIEAVPMSAKSDQ